MAVTVTQHNQTLYASLEYRAPNRWTRQWKNECCRCYHATEWTRTQWCTLSTPSVSKYVTKRMLNSLAEHGEKYCPRAVIDLLIFMYRPITVRYSGLGCNLFFSGSKKFSTMAATRLSSSFCSWPTSLSGEGGGADRQR